MDASDMRRLFWLPQAKNIGFLDFPNPLMPSPRDLVAQTLSLTEAISLDREAKAYSAVHGSIADFTAKPNVRAQIQSGRRLGLLNLNLTSTTPTRYRSRILFHFSTSNVCRSHFRGGLRHIFHSIALR
jgi:hypothetical protein